MLICCSSDCERCKQCGRYIYNLSNKYKNQMNTVENLASFGWGSIGMNAQGETHCETHTDCGFNGKYAMFEPIESIENEAIMAEQRATEYWKERAKMWKQAAHEIRDETAEKIWRKVINLLKIFEVDKTDLLETIYDLAKQDGVEVEK